MYGIIVTEHSYFTKLRFHYLLFLHENRPFLNVKLFAMKRYNKMTSCPVNAHLTHGPRIYFNAFIHVYSPRADNPLGTDGNRKAFSLCPPYVASFKMISS